MLLGEVKYGDVGGDVWGRPIWCEGMSARLVEMRREEEVSGWEGGEW